MNLHNVINPFSPGNRISTDKDCGLKRSKSMSDIRLFDRTTHGESTSSGRSVSMDCLNLNPGHLTSTDNDSGLQRFPMPDTPISDRNTILITIDCSKPEEKNLGMCITLRYFPFEIKVGDYVKKFSHIDLNHLDKELMQSIPEPTEKTKVRIITKIPISKQAESETASKKTETVQSYEFNQEESKNLCSLLKYHYKTDLKLPYMDCNTFISYINGVRTFPTNEIKWEYEIENSELNRDVDNTGKDITLYSDILPYYQCSPNCHAARIINKDKLTLSCNGVFTPHLYFVYLDDLFKAHSLLDPDISSAREISFPGVKTTQL